MLSTIPAPTETNSPHGGTTAILEVRGSTNQQYALDFGRISIGRAPDNDVQLADPSISGHHCEIVIGPSGIVPQEGRPVKRGGPANGARICRDLANAPRARPTRHSHPPHCPSRSGCSAMCRSRNRDSGQEILGLADWAKAL